MTAIEKLTQLEETGKHVFHGSANGSIEILEPRQATHVPDLKDPTKSVPDGEPAVSATPYADIATFRAMINKGNIPFNHSSGFGMNSRGVKNFQVSSEKVLEELKDKKGFVYVFDKKEFKPYSRDGKIQKKSMEWRSHNPVKPIDIVEVSSEDLPPREKIKITGQ